jgi:hypothetical protein
MSVIKHVDGNAGGVNPVQFVFWEDVATYVVNLLNLAGTITLKPDHVWKYLYATPETIQVEVKEEDTPSGIKYICQIKMLIPKDRPEVESYLYNLNNRKLIINVLDKNGVNRFFGNMETPMKKLGRLMKPATIEGYNGWEVVFNGEFSSPPAYSIPLGEPFLPNPTEGL